MPWHPGLPAAAGGGTLPSHARTRARSTKAPAHVSPRASGSATPTAPLGAAPLNDQQHASPSPGEQGRGGGERFYVELVPEVEAEAETLGFLGDGCSIGFLEGDGSYDFLDCPVNFLYSHGMLPLAVDTPYIS